MRQLNGVIGISISLYNKFDDLGVLLDIIQENWQDEYYVSVCSNHPDAEKKIESYTDQIDYFIEGAQINVDDAFQGRSLRENFLLRVNDTIRKAMEGALAQEKVEYILHLHSDAWPLSEQGINKLVSEMEERQASMGFKVGTEKFLKRYPPGHFMDQFMMFDADKSRSSDLFEREILSFPPGIHSHRLLPMICLVKFGWENLYHYSNRDEEVLWDGTPTLNAGRRVRPMMYNPKYEQIHIAREDFGDNLGKALQAHYLKSHGINNGKNITKLIDEYYLPQEQLFLKLEEYYNEFDKELRWYYGVSSDSLGRSTKDISEYTGLSPKEKMIKFFEHYIKMLGAPIHERLYQVLSTGQHPDEEVKYVDLHQYFRHTLDTEEFPKEYVQIIESIYK
jgi:hypothetical protein